MVSFAGSEWSFAQLRLEAEIHIDEFAQIAAVVRGNRVYALTSKGWLVRAQITNEGGSLQIDTSQRLLENYGI